MVGETSSLRLVGLIVLLVGLVVYQRAEAVDATWNGTNGNWTDAARWSTNPEIPDNSGTTYDVFVGGGTLAQNVVGGVTLDSLTWSGGMMTGAESVTVLNAVTWSDGSLANSGGLIVPLGSVVTYSGNSTQHKMDSGAQLVVGGNFVLAGNAELNTSAAVGNGATIEVLEGATFDIQGNGNLTDTFFDNFGQLRKGTVENAGLFTKSAGSGTSLVTDDWTIHNSATGVFDVSSGKLQFSRNGNGFNNAGLARVSAGTLQVGGGTSTGTFQVGAGGTLRFATQAGPSIVHVLDGATIDNAGTLEVDGRVRFVNGATIEGNPSLSLVGSDAEIGGTAPLALDAFAWTAGTLANSGGISINPGGLLTISGSGGKQLANNAKLSIAGTATLAGTQSIVNLATSAAPANVNVLSGGILDLQADIGLSESPISAGSNGGSLVNEGILRKSVGSGFSDVSVDWDVTNNGTIEGDSGTLRFFGSVAHLGTVDLGGGNVEFRGNVSGAGNFTGTGLTTFRRDYRPGAGPTSVAFGGDLKFESSTANLLLEIGGTTAGTEYDQLTVGGSASLAGTLRVSLVDLGSGLFAPQAGNTFDIISAAGGISGQFSSFLPALARDWCGRS